VRVDLSVENLDKALRLIDAAPGRTRIAVARAMNESVRWGQREIRRDIAAATGLKEAHLKGRINLRNANRKSLTATLWIGTYELLASKLGLLVRVPGGVALDPTVRNQKGKRYFGGAFWANLASGGADYFLRTQPRPGSQSSRWTAGRRRTPGTENLPITRPSVDITPAPETVARLRAGILGQFNQRATRLIDWEMEKARGGSA
jgi:hypothetical protein